MVNFQTFRVLVTHFHEGPFAILIDSYWSVHISKGISHAISDEAPFKWSWIEPRDSNHPKIHYERESSDDQKHFYVTVDVLVFFRFFREQPSSMTANSHACVCAFNGSLAESTSLSQSFFSIEFEPYFLFPLGTYQIEQNPREMNKEDARVIRAICKKENRSTLVWLEFFEIPTIDLNRLCGEAKSFYVVYLIATHASGHALSISRGQTLSISA